jgi:hypothetical protein
MNERIKELMKQSMVEHQFDMRFSPEKFAELIVEECMTMCDTVSADYLKHRKGAFDFQDKNIYAEGEAACDIIKYKMKKHFGVEE